MSAMRVTGFFSNMQGKILQASGVILFLLASVLLFGARAQAIEIQDIASPKGVHAWFVQDKTVPVVSIRFDFKGGAAQDPDDKQGMANLMADLLDEGAGNLPSEAYKKAVDDAGAQMDFAADGDYLSGEMKVLSENAGQAAGLLALAVQKPRFDAEPLNRVRDQIIVGIKASENDPVTIARKKFAKELYGNHPYGRPIEGTPAMLAKITRADLVVMHAKLMARDNVKIGIVGPLSKEEAAALIGKIFDALPEHAQLNKISFVNPRLGGLTTVHYDIPQTDISLVYPGIGRTDKDYYAAYLMNYILGGNPLNSRLFHEVREKRGLAYSVMSALINRNYSNSLMIATGTRSEKARQSLETIRAEVKRMADSGVTETELDNAKSYVIGSYAVHNMGSSSDIAATLVGLQDWNLPIDYITTRETKINAVTAPQVNAAAKRLFSAEPAILMVGSMKN